MSIASEQRALVRRLRLPGSRSRIALWLALAVWAVLLIWTLAPGVFVTSDLTAVTPSDVLLAPSLDHPFGTDQYGRDVLQQVIEGAGVSLAMSIGATIAAVVVGTSLGVLAGYVGGAVDQVIMRVVDVLLSFPGMLLALLFQAVLGTGRINVAIAVAVAGTPTFTRLVRGTVRSVRTRTFVVASRSAGVTETRIVARHVLPFLVGPVGSVAIMSLGTAIVLGASLSFLGFSASDGVADWGQLIGMGQDYIATAWWMVTFPGLVITLVVLSAGIIGDRLAARHAEGGQ